MASTPPPKTSVDAGKVIGRGFETLKANFLPFFALALLLVGLPGFVGQYLTLSGLSDVNVMDPSYLFTAAYWGPLAASFFGTFLGTALLQGMLTRSTILHLSGREPDLGASAMFALRLLLPIIGLSICVGFAITIGFICLIVPGIMIWCAFSVAVPALVEERGGVFDSIGRSRALTRGSRFQIFLLGALFWIFSVIISGVAGAITGVATFGSTSIVPNPLLAGAANGLAASLTAVISTVVIAALYVELREIKEGTGANELADVFG
jgi:uncharacterized membrane protein